MNFDDYRRHDATALAELVASGQVSAADLLATAQARLEAVEPRINAVPIRMAEQARRQLAEGLSGPFAGVPFLIKDIAQDYAGVPTTMGSRALRDFKPAQHAEVTRRFLEAGLVVFGKTSTPELALKGRTEPLR
ncbi:amidase family protein, partial [Hydrocarboniphaga effusa]